MTTVMKLLYYSSRGSSCDTDIKFATRIKECMEELSVCFNKWLKADANENKSSQLNIHSEKIILVEIPLPQFSGKYEERNMFKIEFNDIFTNFEQVSEV